jgi:hypothetical protein
MPVEKGLPQPNAFTKHHLYVFGESRWGLVLFKENAVLVSFFFFFF